jgi:hypothetical protein
MLFGHQRRRISILAGVIVAALSGCAQLPTVAATGIPPIPPQQARIWVYRDLQQSAIPEVPQVRLNGVISGVAYQGAAFYRDIRPGHYHVSVDSMVADVNQSSDVDLGAGQEAYVKIQQLDNFNEDEGGPIFATFYARLIPPPTGRAEIQSDQFHGGSDLSAAPAS